MTGYGKANDVGSQLALSEEGTEQADFLRKAVLLLYTPHNNLTMLDSLSPQNLE